MAYLYETHLHTNQASSCGKSRGRDYIQRYIDLGFTGIMVTDHFYRGNTAIDHGLPWKRWVDQFCRGYEDAREEGERLGLDVFFGWEENFQGDEYLIYGLDKEWLKERPQMIRWSRREQYAAVKAGGGCVVQAHPFRQRAYINCIHLSTGCVDGIEIANAGNADPGDDALARVYAEKLKLPVCAGTDAHFAEVLGKDNPPYGIYMESKLNDIGDYVKAIKEGTLGGLHIPPGRCEYQGNEQINLPVDIRDGDDRSTGEEVWQYLGLKGEGHGR